MKTCSIPTRVASLPRNGMWFLTTLLLCAPFITAAQATPPVQPYALYLGADVNVEWGGAFHLVRDVQRESFVIAPKDDRIVSVPVAGRKPVDVRLKKELKLSGRMVQVTGLQVEPTFTPGRDPGRKFVTDASAAMTGAPDLSTAARGIADAENAVSRAEDSARVNPTPGSENNVASARASLNNANSSMAAAGTMALAMTNENSRLAGQMAAGQDQFDAVEVSFRLSSPKPLSDVYVVIVAEYREREARTGMANRWIYATRLDSIDESPRTVRFKQGGLPVGFQLLRHEVHFYSRGRELASTVADKVVLLTRDEAHEYLLVDHLTQHKGETVPATLAIGAPSEESLAAYGPEKLQQVVFVKVDGKGLPGAVFLDEACIRSAHDPFLESVVREARFKPALALGKPVNGVARLKVSDLASGGTL